MATISLRLDDELKNGLDQMCEEMGMSLTTFFTIYAKRALRDRKIPFEITAPAVEPEGLNWDRIQKLTLEAERINGDNPGIPMEAFLQEMKTSDYL